MAMSYSEDSTLLYSSLCYSSYSLSAPSSETLLWLQSQGYRCSIWARALRCVTYSQYFDEWWFSLLWCLPLLKEARRGILIVTEPSLRQSKIRIKWKVSAFSHPQGTISFQSYLWQSLRKVQTWLFWSFCCTKIVGLVLRNFVWIFLWGQEEIVSSTKNFLGSILAT